MPALWDCRPIDEPAMHKQTELTDVSQERFRAAFAPPVYTRAQKVMMGVCFVVFFGWLRIIVLILSTAFFGSLLTITLTFAGWNPIRLLCFKLAACYVRILAWCVGIFWLRVRGSPAADARVFVFNHVSILDGPLLWICRRFTVVAHAGSATTPLVGRCFRVAESAFIQRGRTCGASKVITEAILDPRRPPVGIAPEGKLSDGTLMYRFSTGGFLTTSAIQPVAIRYYRLLPAVGASMTWLQDSFFGWVLTCLCAPGFAAEIAFLDPLTPADIADKTPPERATMTQLRIANWLGVPAISTSTKQFFQEELEKKQE